VEQPGYYTIYDTWDYLGVRTIGIEADEDGARPESLDSAIPGPASPRAQNPTGSLLEARAASGAGDVLGRYSHVLAIEDHHFGDIALERAGSLLADARVEDRVIYIRSFSKSIATDLRLSVAAARRA